jgi:hypothetical protein
VKTVALALSMTVAVMVFLLSAGAADTRVIDRRAAEVKRIL